MTEDELNSQIADLKKEYDLKKQKLQIAYADSNNPYKIGDIVKDHIGNLKIERISYANLYMTNKFQCRYIGIRLNKDGSPSKKETSPVYQSNIKNEQA